MDLVQVIMPQLNAHAVNNKLLRDCFFAKLSVSDAASLLVFCSNDLINLLTNVRNISLFRNHFQNSQMTYVGNY